MSLTLVLNHPKYNRVEFMKHPLITDDLELDLLNLVYNSNLSDPDCIRALYAHLGIYATHHLLSDHTMIRKLVEAILKHKTEHESTLELIKEGELRL